MVRARALRRREADRFLLAAQRLGALHVVRLVGRPAEILLAVPFEPDFDDRIHFSLRAPIDRYFSSRRLSSLSILILRSWRRWRRRDSPSACAAASGSACAPPGGSGTISSITPRSRRSSAVSLSASAARSRWLASFQRMAAHPSGEITE